MKRWVDLMLLLALITPLAACGKKGQLEAPEDYRPSDEIEEVGTNNTDG